MAAHLEVVRPLKVLSERLQPATVLVEQVIGSWEYLTRVIQQRLEPLTRSQAVLQHRNLTVNEQLR
jgi:hypothetical protein